MPNQALEGVKVIDLGHYIMGPYCAKLLADYGADVIKIEKPDGGDPARRLGPFPGDVPHQEKSGVFLHLNTNKRAITLDLATETGRRIFRELVKDADILVENFEPRVMPGWGLSYEMLAGINPKLVMTSISNFGQTGPYRDFKATDIVLFAMGGAMNASGHQDREPIKIYGTTIQFRTGVTAAAATMGALLLAAETGEGQQVDVSAFEAEAASTDIRAHNIVAYVYSGMPRMSRTVATGTSILPRAGYPCKDGHVVFVMTQRFWPRFCRWIGRPDLLDDPDFATVEQRLARQPELDVIALSWLVEHTKSEIMETVLEERIPCAAVYTVADAMADPNFQAREYFVEIDHPVAGTFRYPGAPIRPQETPWQIRRPAPTLGQHNEEVYCGLLGYSKQDLVRLRESGVV